MIAENLKRCGYHPAKRTCLKCNKAFMSDGKYNRICHKCKNTAFAREEDVVSRKAKIGFQVDLYASEKRHEEIIRETT